MPPSKSAVSRPAGRSLSDAVAAAAAKTSPKARKPASAKKSASAAPVESVAKAPSRRSKAADVSVTAPAPTRRAPRKGAADVAKAVREPKFIPGGNFIAFSNANRERVKRENPSFKFAEVGSALGSEWRSMSLDQKVRFQAPGVSK